MNPYENRTFIQIALLLSQACDVAFTPNNYNFPKLRARHTLVLCKFSFTRCVLVPRKDLVSYVQRVFDWTRTEIRYKRQSVPRLTIFKRFRDMFAHARRFPASLIRRERRSKSSGKPPLPRATYVGTCTGLARQQNIKGEGMQRGNPRNVRAGLVWKIKSLP